MWRAGGKALSLVVLVAAAFPALSSAASAATIGGFSVRPAHSNPRNPATRAYFIQPAARGTSFTDQVVVANAGPTPIELRVYPVDGLTGATSGAVYSNRQDPLRHAGRWVHAQAQVVRLTPRSQRLVAFTVRVPRSAQPGDHLAGIAFEDARLRTSAGRFSVTEVVRAVVGILVRVPGPARPRIVLQGVALAPLPGTKLPSAVITLANAGLKLCKPRLAVALSGPGGLQQASRPLDTVLPGSTIAFPFAWPRALRSGQYSVMVRASHCGRTVALRTVAHLGHTLTGKPARLDSVSDHSSSRSIAWWLFVFIGVCGMLAGALLGRLRVTRRSF